MKAVATLAELDAGPKRVTVGDRTLLLYRSDEGVRAYRNVCPHQYGPAIEGRLDAERGTVICPWHGYEFDLETGRDPCYEGSLPTAQVVVEDGAVFVDL